MVDGRQLPVAQPGKGVYDVIVFHPGGFPVGAKEAEGKLQVWNLVSGNLIVALPWGDMRPVSLDFSADGKLLVTGSTDSKAKVWNVSSGELLQVLEPGKDVTPDGATTGADYIDKQKVLFSPSGMQVAATSRRTLAIWDVKSWGHLHSFSIENGEMTSTMKIRRKAVEERYGDLIEAMYRT